MPRRWFPIWPVGDGNECRACPAIIASRSSRRGLRNLIPVSTARKDRVVKMPVYARHGVPYLWLVDPLAHTLEAFALMKDAGR